MMKANQPILPRHVAIIMDGNGRWAKERGLPRIKGHEAGVESIRATVRACGELGIEFLTVYAFSIENWSRPRAEVQALMKLLVYFLRKEVRELHKNHVRLRVIGRLEGLPEAVQKEIARAQEHTKANTGLTLVLALNYGGRAEIVDSVKRLVGDIQEGNKGLADITEESLASYLYTRDFPDPELLIRTSGEMRISNFLLWQISYTELWVTPIFWPDFRKEHLLAALEDFSTRQRRFGGVEAKQSVHS
jgi:undecaprenyl diphosphate synthase